MNQPRRDPQRLFTPQQKRQIAENQRWRCATCGERLPEDFQAHHVIPWSDGGLTRVPNGQAVCPGDCHRQALIKPPAGLTLREWQKKALPTFLALLERPHFATLMAAPGAGKTLFAALLTRALIDANLIDRVVHIVPNRALRKQTREAYREVGILLGVKDVIEYKTDDGVACGYQALFPDNLRKMSEYAEEGRTLYVLDEVHHLGDAAATAWAQNVTQLVGELKSPRARVLNMTGTLFRSSRSQRIATVDYRTNAEGQLESKADDEIGTWELITQRELRNVHLYTYDATFELVNLTDETVEDVRFLDVNEREQPSEAIRQMLSDEDYMRRILAVAEEARREQEYAAGGQQAFKMLVISNGIKHANRIEKICKELGVAEGRVYKATSDNTEAHREIERFRDLNRSAVLIGRDMITEGFDCPDLAVLVHLTSRSARLFINQAVARIMRLSPWERTTGKVLPARVIIPRETRIRKAYRDVLQNHMHVIPAEQELIECEGCGQLKHPDILVMVDGKLLCPKCRPATERASCQNPKCGKLTATWILERNGGLCDDCRDPVYRARLVDDPELKDVRHNRRDVEHDIYTDLRMRLEGQVELLTHIPTIAVAFQDMRDSQSNGQQQPFEDEDEPANGRGNARPLTGEEMREHLGHKANAKAAALFYSEGEAARAANRLPRWMTIQHTRAWMNQQAGFQKISDKGVDNDDILRSIVIADREIAKLKGDA